MRRYKKNALYKKDKSNKDKGNVDTPVVVKKRDIKFELNFKQYIGQTVTVFVNAGGEVGKGFTGVLLGSTNTYIKLLILPSMPPACSLGNACTCNSDNILFCALCPFNKKASAGSTAIIPIDAISAFIHNNFNSSRNFC